MHTRATSSSAPISSLMHRWVWSSTAKEGASAHKRSIQYRVLPITKQNVLQGFETLFDPQNLASSPLGWHDDGFTATNITSYALCLTFRFRPS